MIHGNFYYSGTDVVIYQKKILSHSMLHFVEMLIKPIGPNYPILKRFFVLLKRLRIIFYLLTNASSNQTPPYLPNRVINQKTGMQILIVAGPGRCRAIL